MGGGDGVGVGTAFSAGVFSREVFGGVAVFAFSFSLTACAFTLDLEGFDEPPIKLLSMPHLPFVGSSSGKSDASASAAIFCPMGSGTGVEADGFLWWGFCTTPSNVRKGPLLAAMGLSLRIIRNRRPGAGLQACVEGKASCSRSAFSASQR